MLRSCLLTFLAVSFNGGLAGDGDANQRSGYCPRGSYRLNQVLNAAVGLCASGPGLPLHDDDTGSIPAQVDAPDIAEPICEVSQERGRSVAEALQGFRLGPGFKIECVASEPLVEDPIAFDWSADGRLWVVEMGDYPTGEEGAGKPAGKVRMLTDVDGDGRHDKAVTFLDGLSFPNGVAAHRDGVLITCAPDILFARDTNGDGRADEVTKLYTGFNESNPQHRANGFTWGLDGWWHGADGESNTGILSHRTGERVPIQGRDFKVHPDSGKFELETGRGQFGRQRDDWGNWFANNNSVWAWHAVLEDKDLRRNPGLGVTSPIHVLEGDRRLFPIIPIPSRFNDMDNAGLATSANSPSPYRDELLGQEFRHSLFVSEPVHNIVHRMELRPEGATFAGERVADEKTSEFLASADPWFRPTQIKTGPDGALWVADMYRAVIEHPEWIPDDWEARIDLRAGHDQGRIYRILPIREEPRPIPNLEVLGNVELVQALDHPGGWQRDTAMRLLLERNAKDQVPALSRLASECKSPYVRLQALATLICLGALDEATLLTALADLEPEIVRFAAGRAGGLASRSAKVAAKLEQLVEDRSPRVKLGVALGLAEWDDPRAGRAVASLLLNPANDEWVQMAALSACRPHATAVLAELLAHRPLEQISSSVLSAVLPGVFEPGPGRALAVAGLMRTVTDARPGGIEPGQMMALPSLFEAAARAGFDIQTLPSGTLEEIKAGVQRLVIESRAWALDRARPLTDRLGAIRLLSVKAIAGEAGTESLKAILASDDDPELRIRAVCALVQLDPERSPARLLGEWKGYSPALREAVLLALLERPTSVQGLLFALEDGCVPPAEVPPAIRRTLTQHPDPALRERAEVVFEGAAADRVAVLQAYRSELRQSAGDAEAGRQVFSRVCAACHRFQNLGVDVGPDLASLTERSPEALLVAILDPNRAFETAYTEYSVALKDGRLLTGRIAAETGNSLTLRQTDAKDEVLLRSEIETLSSTGRSLMPEGLERDLTQQDLGHLIAFLNSGSAPPKSLDGNRPAVVQADATGLFKLTARTAFVHGPTLVFETTYGNLGYWSSEEDRAGWSLDVARAGRYEVWLNYACEASTAGQHFVVACEDQRVAGVVASTGTWNAYQLIKIGELQLGSGRMQLELRPDGPLAGPMLDLRGLELRPVR